MSSPVQSAPGIYPAAKNVGIWQAGLQRNLDTIEKMKKLCDKIDQQSSKIDRERGKK